MTGAVLLYPPRTHSGCISLQLQRLVGICGAQGARIKLIVFRSHLILRSSPSLAA